MKYAWDDTTESWIVPKTSGLFGVSRREDLRIPANVTQFGAIQGGRSPVLSKVLINSARGSSYSGLYSLNFKNYINEPFWQSVSFLSQIPHSWEEGTGIDPHVHFMMKEGDPIPSKNLFDHAWLEVGRIGDNNGANRGGNDFYRSSEFIPIEGGLDYSVSYTGTVTSPPSMY